MKITKKLVLMGAMLTLGLGARAQVGIKTNLIGWATTTTNIGVEVGVGHRTTLQAMAYLNPWDFGTDRHFRVWTVQPEYRHWFCNKFNGHFIGVHALGGEFNAKNINFPLQALTWGKAHDINDAFPAKNHQGAWPDIEGENSGRHVEGWQVGVGFSYGYQWLLSKHWNLEASVGVGYVYSPMKYFGRCQQVIDRRRLHYVGPTNAQVSFMYVF